MKNYSQVRRKFFNKNLKKMKPNMIRSIIFKRKIIMNIFLKKKIKTNHPLSYYNNQFNKILKKIKINQIFKIIFNKMYRIYFNKIKKIYLKIKVSF